jgi:hypothetical protein
MVAGAQRIRSRICGVERMWRVWWNQEFTGYAIGVLQFSSLLMYERNENPIFPNGAPIPSDTGTIFFDEGWKDSNLVFLKQNLSIEVSRQSRAQN